MEFQPCQTRGASNGLAQVSDNFALIVNLDSVEVAAAQDKHNLNFNTTVQVNTINPTANLNPHIDNLITTDSQYIRSICYPNNVQAQRFVQLSDGSSLSSVDAPNTRAFANTSDSSFCE